MKITVDKNGKLQPVLPPLPGEREAKVIGCVFGIVWLAFIVLIGYVLVKLAMRL